jgi:hypothetical protein
VGRYVTYRAIYDRLHYEGFIAGSGDDSLRIPLGQADWRGLNNPNTHSVHGLIRPWIA